MTEQAPENTGLTRRQWILVLSLMLSIFLASMEATVVATAMPTIVSDLGGLSVYSWVFSIYMLASTTTVPLYGKLSDLYGRRPIFAVALAMFLTGSLLCGQASSMTQLIAFRLLQGLGAGGLQPLVFTMIGDMFTFEQRARMQGFFSGVWGFSSIVGPLLGGFLVDVVSWHWVFNINLAPGLLAGILIWRYWRDPPRDPTAPPVKIDWGGALVMTAAIVTLLLGLFQLPSPVSLLPLAAAAALFAGLVWVERRASDPILPLGLFRDRLFATALGHGAVAGMAMFGSASFVPLFVQAVMGTNATTAGTTLTPQLLGWVTASILGSRLLLHIGYRTLALTGMVLLVIGAFLLANLGPDQTRIQLMVSMALMGLGMGLSIPSFLIAVQSTVPRASLGAATSTIQFSRSIGGTLGVSIMGAILSLRLAQNLIAAGLDPASVSVNALLDPVAHGAGVPAGDAVQAALANAMDGVFGVALVASVLALGVTLLAPRGRIAQLVARQQETREAPPAGIPAPASDERG